MTIKGDNYFGPAKAKILGGQGSGVVGFPLFRLLLVYLYSIKVEVMQHLNTYL